MSDWLSSLWEPSWRSFRYFNLYRLILAVLSSAALFFPHPWADPFHLVRSATPRWTLAVYLLVIAGGLLASFRWQRHFNRQLTLQVSADILVFGGFMYYAGGVSSGLGVLLLVSLTAASLVGRGQLVLLYAALATLFILGQQILGVLQGGLDPGSVVHAGLLSASCFGTAILARLLGQRVMFNEDLARRRGIALENQERIGQRTLERMQDGVLVVAPDGRVVRRNPVADTLLGLDVSESRYLADISGELSEAYFAWRAGPAPDTVEIEGATGKALRVRFEATASTGGEVLVFLEDLARVQAQAQQLKLASLGRLTASIAHEIRNPLAAISHAGELLREERRTDLQDRLLKIIADNVGRLDRIVSDVLELGREDRAHPERIALSSYLDEFTENFLAAEHLPAGQIVIDCPDTLAVWFDRAHLHRVLWNLLSNARRYCQQTTGSIRLTCRPSGGGKVELHVRDDGPGVSEAVRTQIFEPFFTTDPRGTGLGLFIARDLCEANQARLELGDDPTGGHFVIVGRGET